MRSSQTSIVLVVGLALLALVSVVIIVIGPEQQVRRVDRIMAGTVELPLKESQHEKPDTSTWEDT